MDIIKFLGVETKEFREVWNEMSEDEKAEWKAADLSQ